MKTGDDAALLAEAKHEEPVEFPLMATYRPSASSVSVGYQRGKCMFATRDQVFVDGSKMEVSTIPI